MTLASLFVLQCSLVGIFLFCGHFSYRRKYVVWFCVRVYTEDIVARKSEDAPGTVSACFGNIGSDDRALTWGNHPQEFPGSS
jgi:hypothetical protein